MDKPLVRASQAELEERLNTFHWLLERGRLIGINRMVIPFVDASRIDTQDEFDGVVMLLQRVLEADQKDRDRNSPGNFPGPGPVCRTSIQIA